MCSTILLSIHFVQVRSPLESLASLSVNDNKVHIYGTDIHLWQKVLLELSREEFVVILPTGTCGNTIHRLVTNIQRYLDPGVSVLLVIKVMITL